MRSLKTQPIFLQIFHLISCINSKKTLKKHKSDLFHVKNFQTIIILNINFQSLIQNLFSK